MARVLADEFLLYTKLRKYHWNVTGAQFLELHESFEEQYDALEAVIDSSAERIRQYGAMSIGTLAEFQKHARLSEQPGVNPDARQMVEDIMNDHEAMVRYLRADIEQIDDDYDDLSAEDYLTGVLHLHEKYGWMMRALITGG
jgi:starvation-inducible DNA-binding protein